MCGVGDCDYRAKDLESCKKHQANIHDIDVTFYLCNQEDCEYKTKQCSDLKRHKSNIHDIDVTYVISVNIFQSHSYSKVFSKHFTNIIITVHLIFQKYRYHLCDVDGCDYKAKQRDGVNSHRKYIHFK